MTNFVSFFTLIKDKRPGGANNTCLEKVHLSNVRASFSVLNGCMLVFELTSMVHIDLITKIGKKVIYVY